MTFDEVLDQIRELLHQRGRVTYRSLKLRYQIDDELLVGITDELVKAERVAVDEDGEVLIWTGGTTVVSPQPSIPSPQPLDTPRITHHVSRAEGERRQLTVQFIDLVGSTTLSEQLDPEDYHTRVRAYQAACHQVIARYEGHVAQYLGDGLLVYFGYPTAHEEDAVRAVRSGLEIVVAVDQLEFTPRLQVRIGIHTGLVMVGDIGAGERTERLALGDTPNIAARVQGKAEPNTVFISQAAYRLVQGFFTCEGLGPQSLKNVSVPLELYRVHGEGEAQSRFAVAMQKGLTPLVGRVEELNLLRRHWEHAKAGAGQVVLVSGEPGIGKSRLVQEFKEQLTHERVTHIEFRCSPYHQNSALYPIIDHLQRLLQFTRDESPAVKLEKLQHLLSSYRFPQTDTLPLLAAVLSLPHPEGHTPLTVSPQKQKEKTQAALVAWFAEEAEQAAVFCAWEDLHWADPSTLEVLTLFLDQVPTTRLLAVLTCRPEFTPPWGNRSHLSQLTLSRLEHSQVEAMVERVAGGKTLPPEVVQQIVAKADGVPLFVEELTKTVVEAVGATGRSPLQEIPATLQDSLMARLDRLGVAKEVAQLGATLGREFSYELLHAVSLLDEERLQQGLKQLVEAELVHQRGLVPQAHYLFKHALIQDTAYQSLLKSTRQQYHSQIAQVLVERFTETVETQPELVAQHYTEAGLIAQAIPYWLRAGQKARQRSANVEAIGHLTKGLELLKTLPDTPERMQQEFALHFALAGSYAMRGQFQQALYQLREQCLFLAQQMGDPSRLLRAQWTLGQTLFHLGEFLSAREHVEHAIASYDPHHHRSRAVQDLGVTSHSYLAYGLWLLGYPDQALATSHTAITLAQGLSHSFSVALALIFAAAVRQLRGEWHAAQELAEKAIVLCWEQEFLVWLAFGLIARGWTLAGQGREEEGIAQMRQGLTAWNATGTGASLPLALAWLAEAQGRVGQAEEGLNRLEEALAIAYEHEERYYEAELYRLKGELTLQKLSVINSRLSIPNTQAEAEECFLKALDIARKQQAKSLELRAAMSLVRLWHQQGKTVEGHDLLSQIYNWFTEGFDTKDLQEAKALLEELGH